jgi:hypothetical protein
MIDRFIILFVIILSSVVALPAARAEYLIGTYYFPGWTNNAKGLEHPIPWDPIKEYPEKMPALGWYSDSDPEVLRQQIKWMREFGIGFVAFDWYWDGKNTYLEQALNAFRASKKPGDMKFTLLWANHYKFPGGLPEYRLMVRYWVARYFSDPDFLRIDGTPAVFIFGVDAFAEAAKTLGVSPAELVVMANNIAAEAGFTGIYFIGGTPALEHWVTGVAPSGQLSALSAYNYHLGYSGSAESVSLMPEGYQQLDAAYRQNWEWILARGTLPYVIPMTSGWDKRPWGGSKNPKHDESISTPAQFEAHLREARRLMDVFPQKTKRMGIICCWNEFGEGSYIEPTKKNGLEHLRVIKKVFGQP